MASSRNTLALGLLTLLCIVVSFTARADAARGGLVEDKSGDNQALIVGVSHGLPGIDIDMKNVKTMATDAAFKYSPTEISESKATIADIAKNLENLSDKAGTKGSLLFYFSGHGAEGTVWAEDDLMKIEAIRAAIEKGRKSLGALDRLVMIFDTCHSGSLMGALRVGLPRDLNDDEAVMSARFADRVINVFANNRARAAYWKKLIVIASSRADETSLASDTGSVFTLALTKAFDEIMKADGTVGDLVAKAQAYTVGHHPVVRLEPATLTSEKMKH